MRTRRFEIFAFTAMVFAALALFVSLQSSSRAEGGPGGSTVADSVAVPAASTAPQAVPNTFNYQGFLRNPDGTPRNGNYDIAIFFYDQASGGNIWASAVWSGVPVRDGLFNVVMENTGDLFTAHSPLYIGVKVNGEPELIPRQRLHPVPWASLANNALLANNATTLVPNASVEGLTLNGTTNINGTANIANIGSQLFVSASGVGIKAPAGAGAQLKVVANAAKTVVAETRAFAVTTNDPLGANGSPTNPFALDIRLVGAPLLANRAVFIQSTDWNTTDGGKILLQPGGGTVSIGSTATKGKLYVTGAPNVAYNIGGFLNRNGAGDVDNTDVNRAVSIWGDNFVVAGEFNAVSDARTKNIQGRSDGSADLATLNRIEITDYTLKDVIANGNAPQKKVIGQQVEKVFPQAVNQHTNVVPDIYQKAEVKDGWIMLATNLQKGERVRLIGDKQEGIYEVLEVGQDKFRTDYAADGDGVFVYGREVKDFRVVDYEAISMLNVSATQELNRLVEKQGAEIETLKAENEALNARLSALEQKMTALPGLSQGDQP